MTTPTDFDFGRVALHASGDSEYELEYGDWRSGPVYLTRRAVSPAQTRIDGFHTCGRR